MSQRSEPKDIMTTDQPQQPIAEEFFASPAPSPKIGNKSGSEDVMDVVSYVASSHYTSSIEMNAHRAVATSPPKDMNEQKDDDSDVTRFDFAEVSKPAIPPSDPKPSAQKFPRKLVWSSSHPSNLCSVKIRRTRESDDCTGNCSMRLLFRWTF